MHAYVADASRYSVRSLQKSNTLPFVLRIMDCFILFPCHISSRIGHTQTACDTEGTSMLVQLRPNMKSNLRGTPYELVPGYFVNSLLVLMTDVISKGSGEHVRLRNLARVSLLNNIKFEVDQIKFLTSTYVRFKYLNINFIRVRRFSKRK